MPSDSFSAFVVTKGPDGQIQSAPQTIRRADLPDGEVFVRVDYSSLNYKDALAISGHRGVVKQFPHAPGIDAVGVVVESRAPQFKAGDSVIVTGFEFGAGRWGGYSQLTQVPADWVLPLPSGLSPRDCMAYGTAGLTAGMCVQTLLHHGAAPKQGEIVVTGASGGVGGWAVAILAHLGFTVVAVSGKAEAGEYLKKLGAARVIGRAEVDDRSNQPLLGGRWSGGVDCVGGNILTTLLRSAKNDACITACGLTAGTDLPLTVYPFILRGVTLAGIDTAWQPLSRRAGIWAKLAGEWRPRSFAEVAVREIGMADLNSVVQEMLAGRLLGRALVRISE